MTKKDNVMDLLNYKTELEELFIQKSYLEDICWDYIPEEIIDKALTKVEKEINSVLNKIKAG